MINARPGAAPSPSPGMPLAYLVSAAGAFVLAALGVAWLAPDLAGHYYQPRVAALTHTVTLGWITLAIMGASLQLIPIVLARPVWSVRLARWQLAVLLASTAGMVAHLYLGTRLGMASAAALLVIGIGMHLVNVALSIRGLTRWTFTARLVAMAHAALALTAVFGLALGIDRVRPYLPGDFFPTLHAHVHLALLGWVAPMILGVSARVYPMFLLAPEPGAWTARLQLWGLAVGAPAVVLGLLGAPGLTVAGALAVAVAAAAHARWIVEVVRRRRRPTMDWGLRFALTATVFLAPASALGLLLALGWLSGPRAALAYAALLLGGWASLTIAGMMLKIVPFLVWYRVFAPRAGRDPVPTLAQLSSPAAEGTAYALVVSGVALLAAALAVADPALIRAAGAVLALGAIAFAAALAHVLGHLASGRGAPLAMAPGRPR